MGYTLLNSYSPAQCASACNAINDCKAINVFVERDPSTVPNANCSNPASIANYKCSFWNATISAASATNRGQYQEQFQTAIAGSDGKYWQGKTVNLYVANVRTGFVKA